MIRGRIFDIQRFSVQDGPGIRTTVFLKGCPLACPWCSNPESRSRSPELGHIDALCDGCGRCAEACEPGAISVEDGGVRIDRAICDRCGRCAEACGRRALKVFGREVSVEESFDEIRKDELYFRNSDGGVTASGGEPLGQPEFVAELFRRCRKAGIHTALDTSGSAGRRALEKVLEHTDLVLFDLKLVDSGAHRSVTGRTNRPILENARGVAKAGIPMIVRIPLIPGFTDGEENLRGVARFAAELGDAVRAVHILPYHRFGMSKYRMLDLEYALEEVRPPPADRIGAVVAWFASFGLPCEVVT